MSEVGQNQLQVEKRQTAFFFDNNCIVVNDVGIDERIKKLTIPEGASLFISDIVDSEMKISLSRSGTVKILDRNPLVISWEDIRRKFPEACPLYPNLIASMSRTEFFKERFRKGLAKAIFDQKWSRVIKFGII
jgi:hypothetical protein